jgi:hypothetical protein
MANLMGYERLRTMYEFDGGEYEIVTGFYDEPLFPNAGDEAKNIKKPKKVKLDADTMDMLNKN